VIVKHTPNKKGRHVYWIDSVPQNKGVVYRDDNGEIGHINFLLYRVLVVAEPGVLVTL
jgi:hypothetical protein